MVAPLIPVRDGYQRWAPTYPQVPDNPLMRAEQCLMLAHLPAVAGQRVLDLACGTGRYSQLLLERGAAEVVALDFSADMLRRVAGVDRVCASMQQLPLAAAVFDVVTCGLAIGHLPDISPWMGEVARVLRPGGALLYSDFHVEAARAGLTRSFTDEHNRSYTLEHHAHSLERQQMAARQAGLEIIGVHEVRVGRELNEPFSGSEEFYARWPGLPLVLVVEAGKSS